MKKGDLVKRRELVDEDDYYIPLFDTAIILTSPYAAVFTQLNDDGDAVYSRERAVVDLIVGARIIQKCPIDFIVKLENKR